MKNRLSMHRMVALWLLLAMLAALGSTQYAAWAADQEDGSKPSANSPDGQTGSSVPSQSASIPTRDLSRILSDGGPLLYAIALCSFLVVTFCLERSVSLRRSRVIPKPFVTRFMQQLSEGQLDRPQALQLCEENGSPVAKVFAGAVRKWGRPSVEVEQGVIDSGERVTNGLRRYLRVFYCVATVGPLLGLMGTVLGMIQTFNVIAASDAQGRPDLLAGGIAKALLNTAGGLAVAIPASILYVFFVSRVDRLVIDIDGLAQEVANTISAEELCDKKNGLSRTRRIAKSEAA
jgi:biopolymer transport protein ExbB